MDVESHKTKQTQHSSLSCASISSITKSIAITTLATIEEDPDQEDLVATASFTSTTTTDQVPVSQDLVHKEVIRQDPVYDKPVHEHSVHEDSTHQAPVHKAPIHEDRTLSATSPADQKHTNDTNNTTNDRTQGNPDNSKKEPDAVDSTSISAFDLMDQYDLDPETFTDDQWDEIMWYQVRYVKNQKSRKRRPSLRDCREIFADADGGADKYM